MAPKHWWNPLQVISPSVSSKGLRKTHWASGVECPWEQWGEPVGGVLKT
jgi:hypothetical protein